MADADISPNPFKLNLRLVGAKPRTQPQAEHLAQHVGVGPVQLSPKLLSVIRAVTHQEIVNVVTNERDAMEIVVEYGWGARPATHQSEYYKDDVYGHPFDITAISERRKSTPT